MSTNGPAAEPDPVRLEFENFRRERRGLPIIRPRVADRYPLMTAMNAERRREQAQMERILARRAAEAEARVVANAPTVMDAARGLAPKAFS